ncbi:conserved hypothetical protein [Thermosinus carboxydivorans Nor1]|uniref:HymD protein n=1 Tax=Thermosinus carboxydivorans Nor1 TaxID=401526 RepID=A1HPL4_9FIRM|nr:ECF transporter S component [Thermosinus carboxydivorans]EAX48080.1 conserved hypothetical protein [Thermosinus carboxydivorans Nor1]
MNYRLLARTALLLALTILFQSLRFFIPIPAVFSTFIIGSLVNGCLLIAAETVGWRSACLIGVIAPVVAYFQQLLPLPVFIVPVAGGNFLLVICYSAALRLSRWLAVGGAAITKAVFLYLSFVWLFTWVSIPPKIAAGLLFAMSWPQFITALVGGVLTTIVVRRFRSVN